MKLTAIAAMASNGIIGRNNELPWYYPEDLKFFKETTLNKTVLMGRNTFESIIARLGKPLPKRKSVVFSSTMPKDNIYNVQVIQSLEEVKDDEVFLIGGAQLYEKYICYCDELLLTMINKPHEGDCYFPRFSHCNFTKMSVLYKYEDFEIRKYGKY